MKEYQNGWINSHEQSFYIICVPLLERVTLTFFPYGTYMLSEDGARFLRDALVQILGEEKKKEDV